MADELNTRVNMAVQAGQVMTVPIDTTLSIDGQAADAKAVGDALALKADKSELQAAVKVNNQPADAQGLILIDGSDIPVSDEDTETLAEAVTNLKGKTAEDIPMSSDAGAKMIAEVVNANREAIENMEEMTGATMPMEPGSQTMVKAAIEARVKTVNRKVPDIDGNIDLSVVPLAENLQSDKMQSVDGSFIIRTTGGSSSVSDGKAYPQHILGTVEHDGYVAEVLNMTVIQVTRTEPDEPITATIDRDTFVAAVTESGTTNLYYTTEWSEDPENYGVTVSGTPVAGDHIKIEYTKEARGTIKVADPDRLIGTGWNLFNYNKGYASVVKYSTEYGYKIGGTYTSLAFSATLTGERSSITPGADGIFNVASDGYVFVTGGNNTDTYILTTWSDWMDGPASGYWEPYKENGVDLSYIMSTYFPYGLLAVGTTRDEIDLAAKRAISRIERKEYSEENRAAAAATGRGYSFDENNVYIVRESPVLNAITIEGEYTVSEHGLEWFTETVMPLITEILYGKNLRDKLERDVLTISPQNLAAEEQAQVRRNIGVMDPPLNGNGTAAQLLKTNGDGTTEWTTQGTPTDAQVGTAVSAWLTAHPEATTTVQDGVISREKLNDDLKAKTDAVPDLKSAINGISVTGQIRASQTFNKQLNGITHIIDVSPTAENKIVTTTNIIYTDHDIIVSCPTGYQYIVARYTTDVWATENWISSSPWVTGDYEIPANTYFALQFRRVGSVAFESEQDKNLLTINEFVTLDIVDEISIVGKFRETQKINKGIDGVTFLLVNRPDNNTITNVELLYASHDLLINVKSGYKYIVATFTSGEWTTANHIANTSWQYGEYSIPKGTWFTVQIMKTDQTAFQNGESDKTVVTVKDLVYREDLTPITERIDALEEKPVLWHIIVTGQSLAVGAEGNPALTVVTPYEYIGKAYQFNGGSRPIDGMENNTGVEEIAILDKCLRDFGSLCEQTHMITLGDGEDQRHAYRGETIDSALGYWFAKLTGKRVLVSNHGFGGKSYNGLKKGTIAYQNSIRAVYHAKEICDRYGWDYKVYAVAVVHGEADLSGGVTADTYKGYLKQWQNDYDADIKAITGQTETVQLFASQTAAASAYNLTESPVPNGVFYAAAEDSDIHLVAPQYCYPLTYASVHMNNYGYRTLGEFFGYHIARRFNNVFDTTLHPIRSVLSGNKITITFNDGVTILYDGNFVTPVSDGHWGFELIDSGSNATISNVAIVSNKVEITLSGTPSANAYISYAYKVLPDEMGKIGYQQGVRGNLRNTWAFDSLWNNIDTVVPQWCAIFSIPVNWNV